MSKTKRIYLSGGGYVTVDATQFFVLNQQKWERHRQGYARGRANGMRVLMHRVIAGCTDADLTVDHIDNDTTNNRLANLRICTRGENSCNRKLYKNNSTGFKGVSIRNGRYIARVRYAGILHSVGAFSTAIEAAHARDLFATRLHGEFAALNFSA